MTALAARPLHQLRWSPSRAGRMGMKKGRTGVPAPGPFPNETNAYLVVARASWPSPSGRRRCRGWSRPCRRRSCRGHRPTSGCPHRHCRPGILHQAIFRLAARRLTTEQRVQRLLLAAARLDGRGARLGRDQREIGRDDQRGLARDGEFVGTRPVQATPGPTSRQQRGAGQTCDDGHQLTHCSSPRERAGRAREARAPAEPERLS